MKYIISLLVFVLVSVSSFAFVWTTYATNSLFNNTTSEIPYAQDAHWLQQGIDETTKINTLKTSGDASSYIEKIVIYLLWFIYLLSVILIIYAWFNLLTWAWDEEKAKKSKTMIIYVVVWIAIIFLAWPIVNFVTTALNK